MEGVDAASSFYDVYGYDNDSVQSMASTYPLPSTSYAAIEYPGPIASTSTASHAQAVRTLGGQARLSKALYSSSSHTTQQESNNGAKNANNNDNNNGIGSTSSIVELNFRPDVTFSHTIPGDTIAQGNNMILLKIVKRRRKRRDKTKIVGQRVLQDNGLYKVEAVGRIDKVVRFRGMADLQYQPDSMHEDATIKLADALRSMDVRTMQDYRFPEPTEDFQDDLRLLPPPFFSRLTLPQIYAYRANPLSAPVTVTKPDGTEVTRLVNKGKYRGELTIAVPFATPTAELPKGPSKTLGGRDSRPGLESSLVDKILKLFEQRPVWSRSALLNHLTKYERSRIQNLKITLPFVCWTFSDGPFRDSCIRFGYDPRQDREARFYQRVLIRNMANNRFYLKKIVAPGMMEAPEAVADDDSHIFDGDTVHRNIGNYQLCDITDPYMQEVIRNEAFVRDECDARDGWWDGEYIEFIRQILRRKFFALLNDGVKLPDEAFTDLVDHLSEWAQQQDRMYGSVAPEDLPNTAQDENGMPSATGASGDGATGPRLALKKLGSLRGMGKRNQKPKAKSTTSIQSERARSRFSLGGDVSRDNLPEDEEEDASMEGAQE